MGQRDTANPGGFLCSSKGFFHLWIKTTTAVWEVEKIYLYTVEDFAYIDFLEEKFLFLSGIVLSEIVVQHPLLVVRQGRVNGL